MTGLGLPAYTEPFHKDRSLEDWVSSVDLEAGSPGEEQDLSVQGQGPGNNRNTKRVLQ